MNISSAGPKRAARIVLGILFILASTFHFTAQKAELRMIPRFLPLRRAALYITGVFELLGGIGLLLPRFQRAAGRGLAALLLAIFPANMYHTFTRKRYHGVAGSPLYHVLRWPMQGALIWWALWCSQEEKEESH